MEWVASETPYLQEMNELCLLPWLGALATTGAEEAGARPDGLAGEWPSGAMNCCY